MLTIEEFHDHLKSGIEAYSDLLKGGELFLPKYLKGKEFVSRFAQVPEHISRALRLKLETEVDNSFHRVSEMNPQRVDFVFSEDTGKPCIFLELESLDRSQLYLFHDGPINEKNNDNKLWYYHGTLTNFYASNRSIPRYFVFLLVLPDRSVEDYHLWDMDKDFHLLDATLREVVYKNPYRFYDAQIKAAARGFLRNQAYTFDGQGWKDCSPSELQQVCELVFITCTGDRLVLSRGKDFFAPEKERSLDLHW